MNILSFNVRGIRGGGKASWLKEIRKKNNIGSIALQETLAESVTMDVLDKFWGNRSFEYTCVDSIGHSGGIIWMWDPKVLKIDYVLKNMHFLLIRGSVVGSGNPINLLNIYAPQSTVAKRNLWAEISSVIDPAVGAWVLAGDFNAVRGGGLLALEITEKKLRKLDKFLVCPEFFDRWSSACVRVIQCYKSDHCPILLKLMDLNFGPRPFRIFNSWIGKEGFVEAVRVPLEGFVPFDPPDSCLSHKFAIIRSSVKAWIDEFLSKERESENVALVELESLEAELENRDLSEDEE
ncbi:uncharacterized protein LOC110883502 [Helianthus annuus]|uniref:uncharacterized protein LOC110883502 n=1 Tax=Helianthus annuus TaxID=4232 RepID=UPI000B904378|nr:uncharacterized protein LOC110883502 [Helianthus annuus]